jgi:hypothetical protein
LIKGGSFFVSPRGGLNSPYYEKYIEKYIFIGYNLLGRSSGIENL